MAASSDGPEELQRYDVRSGSNAIGGYFELHQAVKGPSAESVEKHEPASDIETAVMDSLKALDPNRPIREADITLGPRHVRFTPESRHQNLTCVTCNSFGNLAMFTGNCNLPAAVHRFKRGNMKSTRL